MHVYVCVNMLCVAMCIRLVAMKTCLEIHSKDMTMLHKHSYTGNKKLGVLGRYNVVPCMKGFPI